MDSKEQSDALWIVIRDAVQLLNVAYLWKVPVDEQWRMSYQELTERINKLSGRPETPEGRPAPAANTEGLPCCTWFEDADDYSAWETSCGNMFQFTDGGPAENHAKFCMYCGKPIESKPHKADDDEEDDAALRQIAKEGA